MDTLAGGNRPEIPISTPLSRPDRPEPRNQVLHATHHRGPLPVWDIPDDSAESRDSTSPSPSSAEPERNRDDGGACDKMVEKWRLIKSADMNRARKKIHRTDDVYTKMFGKNYSKFYDAFQQGIRNPEPDRAVAKIVPAKRHSAAPLSRASKRKRQDERASLPLMDRSQAPIISAQPLAVLTTTKTSTGADPSQIASPASEVMESSVRPRPNSDSAAKDQPSRRKGVGLYAGNWEYVTDEEKIPEYLSVAEKIADVEGRTTRRAYAKLTSEGSAREAGKLIRSSFENQVRKSGRARNTVDYARLSTAEDHNHEAATRERPQHSDLPSTQEAKQTSPSTSASSNSNRSTLMPNEHSRSTSLSIATNTEPLERPKLSWNAIVYEVLALADAPLTFTQLMQDIKKRYPFFKSSSQEKVLKSGLKNPLYFHEAFIKGDVIDGKQTWGLKPGEFVDKKTGELLTPQPRHPIISPSASEQLQEHSPTPVALTPKVSHVHRPRSSNPRFGREILNSPEIPDSQDPILTASSPRRAASHGGMEHVPGFEEPTGAQKLADGANGALPTASPESNVSLQSPPPHSRWPTTTGSPAKPNSIRRLPIEAVVGDKDIPKLIGPIDLEASAKAALPLNVLQAAQPPVYSIPSSIGESENRNNPATTVQVTSTPTQPANAASPKDVSALYPGCAAEVDSTSLTHSVTFLPDTQFLSQDAKAGAKENIYVHMPR